MKTKKKPQIIQNLEDELFKILSADDRPYVDVPTVAKFLGMDKECLRRAIESGYYQIGFGMPKESNFGRGFCKISKLALYNYQMEGDGE